MIGADEQRKFLNFKTSQMAKNDYKNGYSAFFKLIFYVKKPRLYQ